MRPDIRKWTKQEKEQLLNYVNEGYTDRDIARLLWRSVSSVKSKRKWMLGIDKRGREKDKLTKMQELEQRITTLEMQLEIIIEEIRKQK